MDKDSYEGDAEQKKQEGLMQQASRLAGKKIEEQRAKALLLTKSESEILEKVDIEYILQDSKEPEWKKKQIAKTGFKLFNQYQSIKKQLAEKKESAKDIATREIENQFKTLSQTEIKPMIKLKIKEIKNLRKLQDKEIRKNIDCFKNWREEINAQNSKLKQEYSNLKDFEIINSKALKGFELLTGKKLDVKEIYNNEDSKKVVIAISKLL